MPNVYEKDGKFYTDEAATKLFAIKDADDRLSKISIEVIKTHDSNVFKFMDWRGNPGVSQNWTKDKIEYEGNSDLILAKGAQNNETLTTAEGRTYTFSGRNTVKKIEDDGFKFETGSYNFSYEDGAIHVSLGLYLDICLL